MTKQSDKRQELIQAQIEYCKKHELPVFIQSSGYCISCKEDIVEDSWDSQLITGCPLCHRSFCD